MSSGLLCAVLLSCRLIAAWPSLPGNVMRTVPGDALGQDRTLESHRCGDPTDILVQVDR